MAAPVDKVNARIAESISFTPAAGVEATNVQAAIEEVAGDAAGGGAAAPLPSLNVSVRHPDSWSNPSMFLAVPVTGSDASVPFSFTSVPWVFGPGDDVFLVFTVALAGQTPTWELVNPRFSMVNMTGTEGQDASITLLGIEDSHPVPLSSSGSKGSDVTIGDNHLVTAAGGIFVVHLRFSIRRTA